MFFSQKIEVDGERKLKLSTADENRELKVSSNLQMTTGNNNNEITIKESSFHQGVAVPMTLEDYEKEIAREKELLNKAKKKMAVESSTPKDGISTWILLSGSNNPTTRPEMMPAFRLESSEKKPARNSTMTTKKRPISTTTRNPKTTAKPASKYSGTKVITRVKVTSNGSVVTETDEDITTKAPATTKKPQLTTKAKKYTTVRPKTTTVATTTTTEAVEIIDDANDEPTVQPIAESSTFLIMEPKDADFDLPNDREPLKAAKATSKPVKTDDASKLKKKKKTKVGAVSTNTTRIKKKSDKKTTSTKLTTKNPEKPITTQIYNYLAREVMPTVGVGLVGLVVTAGLATYFLGGPLTALRRSYDVSNRRDDMAYDRSDDFGNTQAEEEMFGKVIAGMPENSAYRNNLRVSSYRGKPQAQPYSGYKYHQQSPTYAAQQQIRYRTIDPYQNSYQGQNQMQNQQYPQYYQQQVEPVQGQAKSSVIDYSAQGQSQQQQPSSQVQSQNPQISQKVSIDSVSQKFNIDSVDMTTHKPEVSYSNNNINNVDYDDIAQSYFPQQDPIPTDQVTVEQQKMQEVENSEVPRSERITIVQAQSVPSNHREEKPEQTDLPTPAALTMSHSDEEYQNSIANAIMNQKKQFVVGSVVAENFEESLPSVVPEHGPRRRRRDAIRKAPKSLENNEIDEDEDKAKRETAESTTLKTEDISVKVEETESTSLASSEASTSENLDVSNESTTQQSNVTYNIENPQNNIFQLFRRIIDMKLRMGLNFLQNATIAFQQYLKGVEQRVNTSPLFNPYLKNETAASQSTARKSNKVDRKKVVEAL